MVFKNDTDWSERSTHLFMLRLWIEDLGNGQTEWRGSVQHVNSGEVRYLRDWPTLEAFAEGLLRRTTPEKPHFGEGEKMSEHLQKDESKM